MPARSWRKTARPFASTRATELFLPPVAFRKMRTARGFISGICTPTPHTLRLLPKAIRETRFAWLEDVDAAVDDSFSNAAAWVPVSLITRKDGSVGRFFHLIDRAKPGVIAVTREGRRFTNESENYHDFVRAMMDACAGREEVSAFMICDHRTIRRYGLGAVRPSPLPIFPFIRSGYLKTGRSIRELASSAGINPENLERTIEEVNQ